MDSFCPTSGVVQSACMQDKDGKEETHLGKLLRIFFWWESLVFSLRVPRFLTGFLCSLFFGLTHKSKLCEPKVLEESKRTPYLHRRMLLLKRRCLSCQRAIHIYLCFLGLGVVCQRGIAIRHRCGGLRKRESWRSLVKVILLATDCICQGID